jgi:tetratricopeptide (TPR) repeat protein
MVATTLHSLGELELRSANHDAARALFTEALSIQETMLGSDSPRLALTLDSLARLAMETGDHAEAEVYFRRTVAIREEALGDTEPLAHSLEGYAELLRRIGRDPEADEFESQARSIRVDREE